MNMLSVRVWLLLSLMLPFGCLAGEKELPLVGDVDKGRVAVERCADCHGLDGVSAKSGAPFIAGLKQEYLVRSLLAYVDGARRHAAMKQVSESLNPIMLADVTAYYASLDSVWQGAVAGPESKAILADTKARSAAKHIVSACHSCHVQTGRFQQKEAIPTLDGLPLEYFVPALKSYINGERHNEIMANFKSSLSEQDIYNLAAYFAARVPHRAESVETGGNPARGKILAQHCAGCHGEDGNSLNPRIPNLAGQAARYLVKATRDYRDGARTSSLMQAPVQALDDNMIADLAAYYSHQQPKSQLHTDITSEKAFNPLSDGEKIAAACNSCHGKHGNSTTAGVPSLTGLSVKYIVSAVQAYQQGTRQHAAMQTIVSFFSDTDIEKVAYYYAMQAPLRKQNSDANVPQAGEQLSAACSNCHGPQGVSDDPAVTPGLAGQDAAYFVTALEDYAVGKRRHKAMQDVAEKLDADAMKTVATYYAAQTPQQVTTHLPDDPARLVEERCSRCHGDRGYGQVAGVPRLAGQIESYLVLALQEYQSGVRKDKTMFAMADVLSLLEIKAIAAYYAKQ